MKPKQTTNSTQQQTSNRSVDEYGYPLYLDAENDPALSKSFADIIDYYAEFEAQSPKEAVFHSDQPWVDCPDPWNLRGRLPMTPVWKDPAKAKERWDRAFNYLAQLKRPNPPTPEAVTRAQFVDKTYVWKEPGKETKPS
jgi:hypothetical protein